MYVNLQNINVKDRKKLEAHLREYKNASNFADALYCNYPVCTNDFLREFKEEFVKVCNYQWKFDNERRISFKVVRSYDFYKELFGEE